MPRSPPHPESARERENVVIPAAQDRTILSRFEIKYLVSPHLAPAIRRHIGTFLRPDVFTVRRKELQYPLCSLYLDTADLKLCKMTLDGNKNRFKLRIRSYSDDPLDPVYFEVKRRVDRIILKRRAAVDRSHIPSILAGRLPPDGAVAPKAREALDEFCRLTIAHRMHPVTLIRYQREAYETPRAEPLRITFDTAVAFKLSSEPVVSLGGDGWTPTPVEATILEVKFNHYFPSWIGEMVRMFELQQVSVAKYVRSMTKAGTERLVPPGPRPPARQPTWMD